MAANKAKRSIPLSQPVHPKPDSEPRRKIHPEACQPMPVKVHVYRTLAELNGGFEKVLQDLQTLGHVNFFRSGSVTATHTQISRIRAQLNRELSAALRDREAANAGYFDRLCGQAGDGNARSANE